MKDALGTSQAVISYFRESVDKNIPAQQMDLLMQVAQNEGVTMEELRLSNPDMQQSSISKNLSKLGDGGYGMIFKCKATRAQNTLGRTTLGVYLTANGKKFLNGLVAILSTIKGM